MVGHAILIPNIHQTIHILTTHSCGKNCNNGIENTVQIIFSYRIVEMKENNICPVSFNFYNYALMLRKRTHYTYKLETQLIYIGKLHIFYTLSLHSLVSLSSKLYTGKIKHR